jgi:hypothetical protein
MNLNRHFRLSSPLMTEKSIFSTKKCPSFDKSTLTGHFNSVYLGGVLLTCIGENKDLSKATLFDIIP